jgi:hypothetical protein
VTRDELILALKEHTNCELTDNVLMTFSDQELRDHLAEHHANDNHEDTTMGGWPD